MRLARCASHLASPAAVLPRSLCYADVVPLVHTAPLLWLQVHSLYWAFTTLTVVGYGDRGGVPQNEYEMAFVLLMELLGVCVTGYVIGTISQASRRPSTLLSLLPLLTLSAYHLAAHGELQHSGHALSGEDGTREPVRALLTPPSCHA
jgi:hypothetical protein